MRPRLNEDLINFFIFGIDTIHSCYSNLHFLLKITKNLNGLSRKDGRI